MHKQNTTLLLSAGFGFITGMRSMSGLAFLSRHFLHDSARARGAVSSVLRSPRASALATSMAAGEMAADKLPVVPDRTNVAPLLGRAALGALAGVATAEYRRGSRVPAAIAGGTAAVASTFLFHRLRKWATETAGLPDWVAAVAEDGIVLTAGSRLTAGLAT